MNITFTINVDNFLDAAAVEELLKEKHIRYACCTDCDKAEKPVAPVRKKRKFLSAIDVRNIEDRLKNHPTERISKIARLYNVSSNTIAKVRDGNHIHQRGKSKK